MKVARPSVAAPLAAVLAAATLLPACATRVPPGASGCPDTIQALLGEPRERVTVSSFRVWGADPEDGEADTVGGYVTESLGKIGEVGDRFQLGEFDGRVTEMQGRRVSRIYLRASTRDLTPSTAPEFVSE